MFNKGLHEGLQAYLEQLYNAHAIDIKQSLLFYQNEQYGEVYYYGLQKLLAYLNITDTDHVLDIGSGLGKVMFQSFLTTDAASVSGIEINPQRYQISRKIEAALRHQLPDMFTDNRRLDSIGGDFLQHNFDHISVIYVCATIFSFELLHAMGQKINSMQHVRTIASFGKLPNLIDFKLINQVFVHADWERVPCFIYERVVV